MCIRENREFRSWRGGPDMLDAAMVPGDYLRDDVLRLCDCVCVRVYICVIANASAKMIAILPPRGTYAAVEMDGRGLGERNTFLRTSV